MKDRPQNYQNHPRLLPPFHFFVLPVLLVNALYQLWQIVQVPSFGTVLGAIVGMALLVLALMARAMAIRVQDRVIRLEMRLRLQEVLPADLHDRIEELTPSQLAALRFASDAELAGLVREVLAGSLTTSKAIKMRVKDWQADWLRA